MAKDDMAIVIGIQTYPGLDTDEEHLSGPDNDARAFKEWLIDKEGGDVPEASVILITTSSFSPPFNSPAAAKPTEDLIRLAIEGLQNIADKSPNGRLGRRLYIYMAGHGFAPRADQTALLMANATKRNVGPPYHWLGEYTAEWFRRSGYFDEIVLFMDCCRDQYRAPAINEPWICGAAHDYAERVKRFYAFATRWSLKSREEKMPNGMIHGIFTYALLEGLKGKAYQPPPEGSDASQPLSVTTDSLRKYLVDSMTNQEQVLMPSDFIADDFEIVKLPPSAKPAAYAFPVTIHLPSGSAGKNVEILDSNFKSVENIQASSSEWQLSLGKGLYMVRIKSDDKQALFPVTGTGAVDVAIQ